MSDTPILNVFADGSITGSHWAKADNQDSLPHAWCGYVIKDADGRYLHHHSMDLREHPEHSANVAEFFAVRIALFHIWKNRPKSIVRVFSDSQLTMRVLSGQYQCHNERLRYLRDAVRHLATKQEAVTYTWIPRESNLEADVCSRIYQVWGYIPPWEAITEYLTMSPKQRKSIQRIPCVSPSP